MIRLNSAQDNLTQGGGAGHRQQGEGRLDDPDAQPGDAPHLRGRGHDGVQTTDRKSVV